MDFNTPFLTSGDFIIKFGQPVEHDVVVEKKEPLAEELLHFIECVREGKSPMISGNVGLLALKTALKTMDIMNINS